MTEQIWRLPRVIAATGMRRSWIYKAISDGHFPAPVKLGDRAVGWKRTEVEAWLQERPRKKLQK
ncbi:helix-turn-helix transcriptional regulator [Profundibacter sp.]